MALVQGYVNGRPAMIPDNFITLWPEVFSLEPPEGAQGAAEEASAASESAGEEPASKAPAPRRAPKRKVVQ